VAMRAAREGNAKGGSGAGQNMRPAYMPDREVSRFRHHSGAPYGLEKGWKKRYFRQMPSQGLTIKEMMRRIVTVLIDANEGEYNYGYGCLKNVEIAKEIGLYGHQIEYWATNGFSNALYLLYGQKIINKVTTSPIRWEIHEEYRKFGLPPISKDPADRWKLTWLLEFDRTKPYKFGPQHGQYRPDSDSHILRDSVDGYDDSEKEKTPPGIHWDYDRYLPRHLTEF
jgi:hypothetical protein